METLHTLLCIIMIICGSVVAFSANPIESILFLIFSFLNAGIILALFNIEFFSLIFIMVYVGAVSVLFLFVVMMLNIKKDTNYSKTSFKTQLMKGVLYIFGVVFFMWGLTKVFAAKKIATTTTEYVKVYDNLNNIDVLGQVLYNHYLICFLIAGLILLVALIGSITLTLRYNTLKKSQVYTRQLARTDNFLSFFK